MAIDFRVPHVATQLHSKPTAPDITGAKMPGVTFENFRDEGPSNDGQYSYAHGKGAFKWEWETGSESESRLSSSKQMHNRRRKRVIFSTNASFAEGAISSLMKSSEIEFRLISDDTLDYLSCAGTATCYMDTPTSPQPGSKLSLRSWMNITAAELVSWADMLIVSPMDAGTLGSMMAGLTTSLTLTVLRGWDTTKTVILVPGMSVAEWQCPISKRQLDDLSNFWPWVKVLPPILSRFEPPSQLVEIPWDSWDMFGDEVHKCLGFPSSSSTREVDDATKTPSTNGDEATETIRSKGSDQTEPPEEKSPSQHGTTDVARFSGKKTHSLPPEILSMIFETLADWEIATAVGVYARIPMPEIWAQYIPKPGTPISLEYTVLRGSLKEIEEYLSTIVPWRALPNLVTHLIFKFSRTDILDYLCRSRIDLYLSAPRLTNLPSVVSSTYGHTALLTWWRNCSALPTKGYLPEAVDSASRAGFLHVLDWWRQSGLPFLYTERALESASAEGRVPVLDWWKNLSQSAPIYDPVPLKIGKSALLAAQSGRTASLEWWEKSGIPYSHAESIMRIASTHGHVPVLDLWHRLKGTKLIFDNQVLVGATKNGHVEVLEWWKRSGLRVEFKTCDIEEALEDAVAGAEQRARTWWARNGLNLGVGTNEWMKVKVL
ncbi:hypothetical protein FQN51_009321 [Onygenales sp. PD_10]|nr:hypothetical protein FQN51_009321 [Onygenales sp. PD_10]